MIKAIHYLENVLFALFSIIELLYVRVINCYDNSKTCLLISHDMSRSGAPQVLLTVASTLRKKHNYRVIVVTNTPGELVPQFMETGCIVISSKFFTNCIRNWLLKSTYSLVLVNTIVPYDWVSALEQKSIKFVWWIHEGFEYLDSYHDQLPTKLSNQVCVWYVSDWVKNAMRHYGLDYAAKIVPYPVGFDKVGIWSEKLPSVKQAKFQILIVGSICSRKNQLEVIRAIQSTALVDQIQLTILGSSIEPDYYKQVKLAASSIDTVFINSVSHDRIWEKYCEADVVVCSSNDDPLPVVVTESLKYGVPVIVSSKTGQYEMITDGVNGFKYLAGNINQLAKKIQGISKLTYEQARRLSTNECNLFAKKFSNEEFEKRLDSVLNS